jgi:inositol transporter-like SP family MFS transporter
MGADRGERVAASSSVEDQSIRVQHWWWAVLIAMAAYIDAGSIVAGAVSLPVWAEEFGLTAGTVGLIAAFSSNGISCGIGALIGGPLGDRFGRKRIYTLDLIVYMVGVLTIAFAPNASVVIIGYVLTGLAVGVDIPTAFSLLAEIAPTQRRSRLFALGPGLWLIGPIIVYVLAALLVGTFGGEMMARIVFIHLAVVAFITFVLRLRIPESARWRHAREAAQTSPGGLRVLFSRRNLGALAFITAIWVLWNLPAGTSGIFIPTILQEVGVRSPEASYLFGILTFVAGIVMVFAFGLIGNRVQRRLMFCLSAAAQAFAYFLLLIFPLSSLAGSLLFVVAVPLVGGFLFPISQLWAAELFPTNVRSTLQGITIAVPRLVLGVWSLGVPAILAGGLGFSGLALMLGGIMVLTAILGLLGPNTQGKSLEEIEKIKLFGRERGQRSTSSHAPREEA